jgi:hypothetical protein
MLLSVVSSMVMAQVQTGRIRMASNGASQAVAVFNSAQQAFTVSMGASPYTNPCVPNGTALTAPQLRNNAPSVDGNTLFTTDLAAWSYPTNVSITKLTFKFCYYLNGTNYTTSSVIPIFKNNLTGIVYQAPTVAWTANGRTPPFNLPTPYSNPSGLGYQSVTIDWVLPVAISSIDWANIEIGFKQSPVNPVHNILGMDVRATFVPTSPALSIIPASLTYTPNVTWSNGVVNVYQSMPAPSGAVGAQLFVRCGNGLDYFLENYAWGSATAGSNVNKNYPIYFLNTKCPGGAGQLVIGSTTRIRSQVLQGTTPIGSISYSSLVTLN